MQAHTLNFAQLFGADAQYVVPMFQRPYVWEREKQWEPLWQDCIDVVEALRDAYARHGNKSKAEVEVAPHFLGAVVLDPLSTPTGEINARHVIDGQQRLTTLQLLISAVHSVAAGYDDLGRHQRVFEKLIANDADLVSARAPEQRFKVWPTKFDRDAFVAAMNGQDSPGRPAEAHNYFVEACAAWAEEARAEGHLVESFDALQVVIRGFLKVVTIDLEPNDNAQAIFEVLNARGTELLAVDLIKNLVFRQAEEAGEDVERLYHEYWQRFDTEHWRREVRVGRLTKARADQFLTYWIVMKTGRDVHAQQIFPAFRALLAERSGTVESVVSDLALHATEFDKFEDYPPESPEGLFFYRLSEIDISVFMPLALLIFGSDLSLSRERRRWVMAAIESWLIRRAMLRAPTKDYNKAVPLMIARARENVSTPAETIVAALRNFEGPNRSWPTDQAIRDQLVTQPMYGSLKQSRLRMFLEAIEDDMRGTMAEQRAPRATLHIEHIMPQVWQTNWPLAETAKLEERDERNRSVHRIGNLTLLTRGLNSAESNLGWLEKRRLMRDFTVLKLNVALLDHDDWNEATIKARGEQLAARVLRLWPGPHAVSWDDPPELT